MPDAQPAAPFCTADPISAAGTPSASAPPIAPGTTASTEVARPDIAAIDQAARAGQTAAARQAYTALLANSDGQIRACAARGLAQLDTRSTASSSDLQRISKTGDNFGTVLGLVWRLVWPALIVFAVLLILARYLSQFIRPDTPGPMYTDDKRRRALTTWYAVGVLGLAVGSFAVVAALSTRHVFEGIAVDQRIVAATALGLLVMEIVLLVCVALLVGRAATTPRRIAAITVGVAAVLAAVVPTVLWKMPVNITPSQTRFYAVALVVSSVLLVSRVRALGLGISISGFAEDGTKGEGVAQLLRARLTEVAGGPSRGVRLPIGTDVSTIREELIGLVPTGTVGKIVDSVLQFFRRATPWEVQVTLIRASEMEVVVRRNTRIVSSELVQAGEFNWPPRRTTSDEPPAGSDASHAAEAVSYLVYSCAAAIVLTAMAPRHAHLQLGLNGATSWRSIGAQLAGTTGTITADRASKIDILAQAVAFDSRNWSAQLALILIQYTDAADEQQAEKILVLLDDLHDSYRRYGGSESAPIYWRIAFDCIVARVNLAEYVAERIKYDDLRDQARERAHQLRTSLKSIELTATSPMLREMLYSIDQVLMGLGFPSTGDTQGPSSRSDYFLRACVHARTAKDSAHIDLALEDLQVAVTHGAWRTWARTDPWLASLNSANPISHDPPTTPTARQLQRFRNLVGDDLPTEFLELAPFIDKAAELRACGMSSADRLKQRDVAWLMWNLSVRRGVADYWLQVAGLAHRLDSIPITALMLRAGTDSLAALSSADPTKLAEKLSKTGRNFNAVPPDAKQIEAWRDTPLPSHAETS